MVLEATQEDENLDNLNEESLSKIKIIQRIIKLMRGVQYEKISFIGDIESFTLIDKELADIVNIEIPQIIQIMNYRNNIKQIALEGKRIKDQQDSEIYSFNKRS